MKLSVIILAAGKGTRMKSEILKVIHQVAGKPIVNYVVDTVLKLGVHQIYMVVGHQAESVKRQFSSDLITFVEQKEQLGTGHAVMQVAPKLSPEDETIIVMAGDCPLIQLETLRSLLEKHVESNSSATILTTNMDDPSTYGRILRGKMRTVIGIKEFKDCSNEEKEIKEINTGVYCFKKEDLVNSLKQINRNNTQNEYYLTDVIHILKDQGKHVSAYCTPYSNQALGINTRMDLAKISSIIYQQNNQYFMQEGVTIIDPATTFIDSTVKIGHDTIVYPFSMILGNTVIGKDCQVGPNAFVQNSTIEDHSLIPAFSNLVGVSS